MSLLERPLTRYLVRFMYLLAGRKWRHAQAWTPGLTLELPTTETRDGSIRYRGRHVASLAFWTVLAEPTPTSVFVVASGPSIAGCDMSRVPDRTAIVVNGAIHLIGEEVREPMAVAIEDERFVWRHIDLMREKITREIPCLLSVSVIRALCEIDCDWLTDRKIVLIDDVVKPYGSPRRSLEDLSGVSWLVSDPETQAFVTLNPALGLVQAGSVAISAFQMALALRPSIIGVFGVDLKNADEPRFYETRKSMAKSGIARAKDKIAAHLALAKNVAEKNGIRVECYSPASSLLDFGFEYSDRFAK